MKILFHNPTCGSGIEQIGYVFVLLLKKLGHDIDLWNTQCANTEENVIAKTIDDYDAVILNEAHELSFNRMIRKKSDHIWNISHAGTRLPDFCKQLSLNYLYHYRFLYRTRAANVMVPLTYPYAFRKEEFNAERPMKFVFVGRWLPEKFHPHVKKFMKDNDIYIDAALLSGSPGEYDFRDVVRKYATDADMNEVHNCLRSAQFLLLPSTTECISLVVGEALVNGCIPIVLDTENEEHQQFMNCAVTHSPEEFCEALTVLKDRKIQNSDREKIFDFSRRMWSIDRSLAELKAIFGTGAGGKIDVKYNERGDMSSFMPYINATIITGERI